MASSEYKQRRRRLGQELSARKLDAALITSPVNIRYLTGFTGSNGLLALTPSASLLLTDPRYAIQVEQEADVSRRKVVRGSLLPAAADWLARRRLVRIGLESEHMTWAVFLSLAGLLPKRAKLQPLGETLSRLRAVKSAAEIRKIRRAVALNSQAYERALRRVRPGMTEKALAAEIDHQMRLLGADQPAFDTIVASGRHAALPHATPTNRPIQINQLLLIDMGALADGYASDMTRVVHLGKPSPRFKSLYQAVLEAQLAGVAAVRPGVTAGSVDSACRGVLRKAGLDKLFTHSTGHGLGLEIHEPPRIGARDETPLEAGMAVTVEPGVYIEGFGGIRIEDTVLVTRRGCEVLTPTSKELRVL